MAKCIQKDRVRLLTNNVETLLFLEYNFREVIPHRCPKYLSTWWFYDSYQYFTFTISPTAWTPFGLHEFVHHPFGLRNEAQTFQRFMDSDLISPSRTLTTSLSPVRQWRNISTIWRRCWRYFTNFISPWTWISVNLLSQPPRSSWAQKASSHSLTT